MQTRTLHLQRPFLTIILRQAPLTKFAHKLSFQDLSQFSCPSLGALRTDPFTDNNVVGPFLIECIFSLLASQEQWPSVVLRTSQTFYSAPGLQKWLLLVLT